MGGLSRKTEELIRYVRQLLEADHPQALRQLHYAVFSRCEIAYENCLAGYLQGGNATSNARRHYRALELQYVNGTKLAAAHPYAIPGRWIVDESRQPEIVNVFQNAAEYVGVVKRAYRRDEPGRISPHIVRFGARMEPSWAQFGRLPTNTARHLEFVTGSAVLEWRAKSKKCSRP